MEFHVCLNLLELGFDGFGAVFSASEEDERFLSFFCAVLFEEPPWTERSAVFDGRESEM
jgi:hypothetical protein